jgi:hypothetical protein
LQSPSPAPVAAPPLRRVVWLIVDSLLTFVADKTKWNGTRIVFDIERNGDKTQVRFMHEGLKPAHECYGDCSAAWTGYVRGSLKKLIEAGRGGPKQGRTVPSHVER